MSTPAIPPTVAEQQNPLTTKGTKEHEGGNQTPATTFTAKDAAQLPKLPELPKSPEFENPHPPTTASTTEDGGHRETNGGERREWRTKAKEVENDGLRERIISDIKKLGEQLGRMPRLDEFRVVSSVPYNAFRRVFSSYRMALMQAGFEPLGEGWQLGMDDLFKDWMEVVQKLKKLPTVQEYGLHGKHSYRPLVDRFKKWNRVPFRMLEYAEQEASTLARTEWQSTLTLVREQLKAKAALGYTLRTVEHASPFPERKADRAIYGRPIKVPGMAYAPTNEIGVVGLFLALAPRLGFEVLRMQTAYPDCEAMRKMDGDWWQRVIIEIEFESRNFHLQGHDPRGCDMIVCWRHNWPECPLEVVELEKFVNQLG